MYFVIARVILCCLWSNMSYVFIFIFPEICFLSSCLLPCVERTGRYNASNANSTKNIPIAMVTLLYCIPLSRFFFLLLFIFILHVLLYFVSPILAAQPISSEIIFLCVSFVEYIPSSRVVSLSWEKRRRFVHHVNARSFALQHCCFAVHSQRGYLYTTHRHQCSVEREKRKSSANNVLSYRMLNVPKLNLPKRNIV